MSDFKAKMHQIRFRPWLRPRPRWGAYSAPPDHLAAFKGPTSKGREGREGSGGDGRVGREGTKGKRGKGAIKFVASGRHRLSYATDPASCHRFTDPRYDPE